MIAHQIREHLEANALISPNQYGFRRNHSTQSLILQLTDKWLKIIDNTTGDKYVCLIGLDLKKDFDYVDHTLLLYKINNYFNFHSTSIKLMTSYLTQRHQRVKINGTISTTMKIHSGVPQSSIFGPLMFIMFNNDITATNPCYLFADDCIFEQYGDKPETTITNNNNLLPTVAHWYRNNLKKLNTTKTSVKILVETNHLPPVITEGETATFTFTLKYLGLILDTSLNWNEHIAHVKRKIVPVIWKFGQI